MTGKDLHNSRQVMVLCFSTFNHLRVVCYVWHYTLYSRYRLFYPQQLQPRRFGSKTTSSGSAQRLAADRGHIAGMALESFESHEPTHMNSAEHFKRDIDRPTPSA
jgi:hypothetical protein